MADCPGCGASRHGYVIDNANGTMACGSCGLVVESNLLTDEYQGSHAPSGGGSKWQAGAGRSFGQRSFTHQTTEGIMSKARSKTIDIQLSMSLPEDMVNAGLKVFSMAMEKRLLTGRRLPVTCSACLYIASRMAQNTPLMLIDFSDIIAESPFAIGQMAEYIMKHLKMELATVDPALFIHKYVANIGIRKKQAEVTKSATVLMSKMNRDWLSQGRRPAGVIAAAIYLAARLHGYSQIRLENVTRALSVSNSLAIKRLEEAKNLYSKVKKNSLDDNTSTTAGALPAALLVQQRRDELLKEYLRKRGKDTSIVDGFVESKTSRAMLQRYSVRRRERTKEKRSYDVAMEKRRKFRKKRKKEAKKKEAYTAKKEKRAKKKKKKMKKARKEENEDREEKDKKKRKRVPSSSGSMSDVEVSSVSTSTVPESVHWGDTDDDTISSTSSDSAVSYESTTDAEAELPLIELVKRRRLRAEHERQQEEAVHRIDIEKAAKEAGEDPPPVDDDTANLDDLRGLEEMALEGLPEALPDTEEMPNQVENSLSTYNKDDVANAIEGGGELLQSVLLDAQDVAKESGDADKEEDEEADFFKLFDMGEVHDAQDEAVVQDMGRDVEGLGDLGDLEDDAIRHVAETQVALVTPKKEVEKFEPEQLPEAHDFEGLSDVSSEGFNEWIVDDEDEYNERRKLWLEMHGGWKKKRDEAAKVAKTRQTRRTAERKTSIMPTTFQDGKDSWDTLDGAVTEAMLHKGNSIVKTDELQHLFGNLNDLVNSSGRREGMASVLDEAMGDNAAPEENAWVSDDEANPWDGFS